MTCDEYVERVVTLLKSGNQEYLEAAARCVLYCSENAIEPSEVLDEVLGLDNTDT